jgi:hypothetical protein
MRVITKMAVSSLALVRALVFVAITLRLYGQPQMKSGVA